MSRLVLDTAERVAGTYAVAFLGLLLADGVDLTSVGSLRAAAIAAIPAGLSVLKAAIGSLVGDRSTVGWVPRQHR